MLLDDKSKIVSKLAYRMSNKNIDLCELMIVINLFLYSNSINFCIDDEDLKNLVKQSFYHIIESSEPKGKLIFQTPDSYVRLIVDDREYLFYSPNINKYIITGDVIKLGEVLFEIHNVSSNLRMDEFTRIINRIHKVISKWKIALEKATTSHKGIFKEVHEDKFAIVQFRQIGAFFNDNFKMISVLHNEINEVMGNFLSEYIESRNKGFDQNYVLKKIDNFFSEMQSKLNNLGTINYEFSTIFVNNESKIDTTKQNIDFILEKIRKIDHFDDIVNDIIILITQIQNFYNLLSKSIIEVNKTRLTNLVSLVRNFSNLIINEKIFSELYTIWKIGIDINLNDLKSSDNMESYIYKKTYITRPILMQKNLKNLKLELISGLAQATDDIFEKRDKKIIENKNIVYSEIEELQSIRIRNEEVLKSIYNKIDQNSKKIDIIGLIRDEELNREIELNLKNFLKIYSSVIIYLSDKGFKFMNLEYYDNIVSKDNKKYRIKSSIFMKKYLKDRIS